MKCNNLRWTSYIVNLMMTMCRQNMRFIHVQLSYYEEHWIVILWLLFVIWHYILLHKNILSTTGWANTELIPTKLTEQLINSLEILTAEFLVKEPDKMFPSHRILQQFLQTESPAFHPSCWDVLPVGHKQTIATNCWQRNNTQQQVILKFNSTASTTVHTFIMVFHLHNNYII